MPIQVGTTRELVNAYIGEYVETPFTPGANTVGYYPLNGDYLDHSGNNRNLSVYFGTPSYTTLSSGIQVASPRATAVGGNMRADGFGLQNVNSVWDFTGDFTISFWGRRGTYSNYMSFATNRYSDPNYRRMNSLNPTQQFFFHGSAQYLTTRQMPENTRCNICCTVISGTYYIYVNGELKKSGSYSYSNKTSGVLNLCFGYYDSYNDRIVERLNGDLSEVIVESAGWTAQGVSDYYNATKSYYGL